MTPFFSWMFLVGMFGLVSLWINSLYVDSLEREVDTLRDELRDNQPPF
jgi:hypothetical protein